MPLYIICEGTDKQENHRPVFSDTPLNAAELYMKIRGNRPGPISVTEYDATSGYMKPVSAWTAFFDGKEIVVYKGRMPEEPQTQKALLAQYRITFGGPKTTKFVILRNEDLAFVSGFNGYDDNTFYTFDHRQTNAKRFDTLEDAANAVKQLKAVNAKIEYTISETSRSTRQVLSACAA